MADEKNQQSQQPAPQQAQQPAKMTAIELMAEVMLKRELRENEKEEARLAAEKKRQDKRDENALSHFNDKLSEQARCRHLKGGKNRVRTQVKDYAVYLHTFINTERVIRCQLCGMKWKPQDTKEFLVREGKKKVNHTRLGWEEALMMVNETSNTPSASEIPLNATPAADVQEVI